MEVNELAVKEILDELNDVKLIAATKYIGIDEINKLENLGVMYFGENRVQAFLEKYQKYIGNCKFHMIGTLQPNKVKYIIDKKTFLPIECEIKAKFAYFKDGQRVISVSLDEEFTAKFSEINEVKEIIIPEEAKNGKLIEADLSYK